MSIKVMAEVWESSSAKGGARLVLLALADFANEEGYCYPSIERLALKSALTGRNVQLILRNLETRGELVVLLGAGRGNVNAYWVLPPATIARLMLEGKNAKNFHPFQLLEEKVKNATENTKSEGVKSTTKKVKSKAQKVKSSAEKVKPTSPRTIKNHQEPSGTTNTGKVETREKNLLESDQPENQAASQTPNQPPRTLAAGSQSSSAARTPPGTAQRVSGSFTPSAAANAAGLKTSTAGAASRAWSTWLTTHPEGPPTWLELGAWTRWLRDLDERKTRITSARLEEQLERLHDLSQHESQAQLIARAISGGWETFFPTRERSSPTKTATADSSPRSNDRYGRYR